MCTLILQDEKVEHAKTKCALVTEEEKLQFVNTELQVLRKQLEREKATFERAYVIVHVSFTTAIRVFTEMMLHASFCIIAIKTNEHKYLCKTVQSITLYSSTIISLSVISQLAAA